MSAGSKAMKLSIEKGPIRPPSESGSLLIRTTRNCPWNRCAFCHTYKGRKFDFRNVDEIKDDIRIAKQIADRLEELCDREGTAGRITQSVVDMIRAEGEFAGDSILSVAGWLYHGGESLFLQDADSLTMKTGDLVEVLLFLRENFPSVKRVTSYCRSRTAAKKSPDEMKRLRDAGLTRLHVGLESGSDQVLEFMRKGMSSSDHVEGGRRIKEAGISLCAYVMPGLGGRRWSGEHADETASVINRIDPDFIRLRSLHVARESDLFGMMEKGLFEPLGDEETVWEIGRLIGALDGITSRVASDHVLNLLEELEGKLPEDKPRLMAIVDRFFALSTEERLIFRVGRRKGIYRKLDDLSDKNTFLWLKSVVDGYAATDPGQLERDLYEALEGFI
jgi:histone acetyltransferase (RNA polymerase elongator complex component)